MWCCWYVVYFIRVCKSISEFITPNFNGENSSVTQAERHCYILYGEQSCAVYKMTFNALFQPGAWARGRQQRSWNRGTSLNVSLLLFFHWALSSHQLPHCDWTWPLFQFKVHYCVKVWREPSIWLCLSYLGHRQAAALLLYAPYFYCARSTHVYLI